MRLAWLVLLVGCEKAPQEKRQPEPARVIESATPKLRYAAKTQNSAAGPNQTFFNIVEDEGLFSVADAGGPTNAGDPAKLAAQAVSPFSRESCQELGCVVNGINDQLATGKLGTASLAVAVFEGRKASLAISGDARVVWMHAGTRKPEIFAAREPGKPLGSSSTTAVTMHAIELRDGDSIAIVNRGLFETVGTAGIARTLPSAFATLAELEVAVNGLIADAERVPEHPALTTIMVHVVPD